MTDHDCKPGCMECDRAERIANDIEQIVTLSWAAATAEIRALHAQREALTQEVAKLREALVNASISLEVLYAVEQQVPSQGISQPLKNEIRDAVHATRYALRVKT